MLALMVVFGFWFCSHSLNSQDLFLILGMSHFITFCTSLLSALSYLSEDVNDSFSVFFPLYSQYLFQETFICLVFVSISCTGGFPWESGDHSLAAYG